MNKQNHILAKLFLLVFVLNLHSLVAQSLSQEVIGSRGGVSINQEEGNLHWTIGETIINTTGGENELYLTQGFHQLYHDLLVTDIEDIVENTAVIQLYPNPTRGLVSLQMHENKLERIAISNQLGQILLYYDTYKHGDQINLSSLPNGIYFLTVSYQHQLIKTFKVIKI